MKRFSISRWFRNVSIASKLYFTVGIMALLIALELAVLVFSINTLSSVRAYVGGEGLWSKAQKEAMYQLVRYGRTRDESDYEKFKEFMKVPQGDHKTLVELSKPNPDLEAARQGFIEGRNHPDDVEGMIQLFSRFNKVYYIDKAIGIWVEADKLSTEFVPIGERLHAEINSPDVSQDDINAILGDIDPLNARLSVLEDDFSFTLGEGSRWLENLVLKLLFAVALTVELTGLILAIVVSRGIQRGLNEILLSAKSVAKGDFSRKAKAFSRDEIGILANNFNNMSEELERSMAEIAQAHKKFEGLLASAPDAIVIASEQGTIELVNNRCESLFGYKKTELVGHNVGMLLAERFRDRFPGHDNRLLTGLGRKAIGGGLELLGLRKNGEEFPVEISLNPLETEEGVLVSAAIRDISERKYIRELESKNKELEQFAYISSHDLQEPLNTIISFISLLEEEYREKLGGEGANYLRYIRESSFRMTALITDLLEYSRIGRGSELGKCDCNELAAQVVADMQAAIGECNAAVNIGPLPTLRGYPAELRALFQNLLSNAIKFRRKDVQPVVSFTAADEGGLLHFVVEDNGIGIDKKHHEKIFIIFQRLNSMQEFGGTGIGLAHCKKIVELHGGKIWVESSPGEGSRFHFTFPKTEQNL